MTFIVSILPTILICFAAAIVGVTAVVFVKEKNGSPFEEDKFENEPVVVQENQPELARTEEKQNTQPVAETQVSPSSKKFSRKSDLSQNEQPVQTESQLEQ